MKKLILVIIIFLMIIAIFAEVENSAWDGSVSQVKTYLKENLKDPKSIEYIEWSKVFSEGKYYLVRCKYRAKNSFGGYVLENQIFFINKYSEKVKSNTYGISI